MKKYIHFVFLLGFCLVSCQDTKENSEEGQAQKNEEPKVQLYDAHSSRNSLDWPGTYHGVLPCEDCDAIRFEVILDRSEQFIVRSQYVGRSEEINELKGTMQWDEKGNIAKLNGLGNNTTSYQFAVEENRIRKLDVYGKRIGENDNLYVLPKEGYKIEDKYYQLIDLGGKSVNQDIHLILEADDEVYGHAGCNRFTGKYQLDGVNLSFANMASTKMACDNMSLEQRFLSELAKTNSVIMSGGILSLRDREAQILMRFQYDFFKTPINN